MAPSFNADLDGDVALVGNFTIWAMALVSGLFLGARVYIRQARNHLWWDDHLLVGGWIFTIAQSAVFSEMLRRVLSAISDFILAFLPLSRMLEVTLKSHDKWVAAVITTSIGVIAGLAGLVKGFEGIRLLDYESTRCEPKPDFHSIWVFHVVGIAEPNATIVACSIPILRTFFRSKRACNGTVIPRGMGPYAQSNSAGKFPGGGGGSGKEFNKHESTDTFSQHTIAQKQRDAQKQREREEEAAAEADAPGITRTRTVAVTYEDNMIVGSPPSGAADIEMLSRSAPI
ncbi:hypothetical protein PG993_009790 [Apiospora rasikravindrae]|uniref:Integral membrane protein n=1 Tax=Apiospora rasikravindrae TaxID=990691 RepID=A0ABR1SKD7_9PEZI